MCNQLHEESKPIPNYGIGWKIFEIINGDYKPLTCKFDTFSKNINSWDNKYRGYRTDEYGFCFFLNKSVAESTLESWANFIRGKFVMEKILYSEGMGKHIETMFMKNKNIEIALCKKWMFFPNHFESDNKLLAELGISTEYIMFLKENDI